MSPLPPAAGDGLRDITAQRRFDEDHRWLVAVVESSEEAMISADSQGTIRSWNRGAERLFGQTRAEMVGRSLYDLADPASREDLARRATSVCEGRPVHHFEMRSIRPNGAVIDISMTISPICDDAGRVAGLSIVARDITEQRWMATTLNSTLASLEQAVREAKESEARYRRFTADAAHQLRTPIAGIGACAEALLRETAPDERETILVNIVRETRRAARLMTGLLQMARLDQGQTLLPRRCDVVGLASDEVERARALAPNLEVEVRVDASAPGTAEIDPNAVHEILANLLDNARRHARRRIEVHVRRAAGGQIEVRVVDDGPGLAEALAERAFERFVSLDGKGGSGLGLPIGRSLARTHGGDLSYEDRAFVLRLPLKAGIDCGGAGRPDFGPPETVPDWESWESP